MGEAAALLWRRECLCCGELVGPGDQFSTQSLCTRCLRGLHEPWRVVTPPCSPIPVMAAGHYGGPRRALVLAMKERLVPDAIPVAGAVLAAGIRAAVRRGLLADARLTPLTLLPAPTRASAARQRGGDVVAAMGRQACIHVPGSAQLIEVARVSEVARDSVGLGRRWRRRNVSQNLRVDRRKIGALEASDVRNVAIIDDVSTTGATLSQFALALAAGGISVKIGLVLASA